MKTNCIKLNQTKAAMWRLGQSRNANRLWSRTSPGPVQMASSECRISVDRVVRKMKLISFLYWFLLRAVLHFPSTQQSHFSVTVPGVNVAIDFLVDVLGSYFWNRSCVVEDAGVHSRRNSSILRRHCAVRPDNFHFHVAVYFVFLPTQTVRAYTDSNNLRWSFVYYNCDAGSDLSYYDA